MTELTSDKSTPAAADIFTGQWTSALQKLTAAMESLATRPPKLQPNRKYDPLEVVQTLADVGMAMARNPTDLMQRQMEAMGEWQKLWLSAWSGEKPDEKLALTPERGDRRFSDQEWEENPYYRQIKQAYLLASRQLRGAVGSSEVPPPKRAMTQFLLEQFLNAIAPTNFVATNPVAVRRTVETGGANLVSGFANLLSDLGEGRGIIRRRTEGSYAVGTEIAATPGSVVFENHLMQVIQYDPATDQVRKRPLLYVPPLVNKYYMIDLRPKSSMIRWLVEQGHTVFVVSWVDPDEDHRNCALEDYIRDGILTAMNAVADATGESSVDFFGFCMGGTLIAITLAYLAARGELDRVGSATLIGSMIDFGDMRDWSAFVHESHFDALNKHLSKKGYIDKAELQQLFSLVRANDLIWSSFVSHYLLDKDAPPSDLLQWFEDGSHIPQAFLESYNKTLMLNNHLRDPGAVTLLGEKLDLTKVTTPIFLIALKDDHVSAWEAVYDGARLFGGPVRFVMGGSGHNAGVINPPSANKHGYWMNDQLPETGQKWLEGAEKHPGSWWPEWTAWLLAQEGNPLVSARKVGEGKLSPIEPAPGRFVAGA